MSRQILATKLYSPPPRAKGVLRPHLSERLNEGLHRKLSLISAPAGFGKTTLVSEWVEAGGREVAWLSLDEGDRDPTRFLTYLVAALQTVEGTMGEGVLAMLESPQPPPSETLLTSLLNEVSATERNFILVLDDYHLVDSKPVDDALTFLLEHLPPHMHLVITTREDPRLPLPRLRARDQLTELRAADLRFTPDEAAEFLNQTMGLRLSAEDVAALETRTEGWIAGLQLAALSMRGHEDAHSFIKSFTGSHRFVLDYLLEEVLQQQPEHVQTFLLRTSILERFCSPLCEAVLGNAYHPEQKTLDTIERANLFLTPLDDERRWYRYHHLFADLLRARLNKEEPGLVASLHLRASRWFEQNDMRPAAIQHALAAQDVNRVADLLELAWSEMDQSLQSAQWLLWVKTLPEEFISNRPVLNVGYAWALLDSGDMEASMTRLQDAEHRLAVTEPKPEWVIVDEAQFRALPATIAAAKAFHAQVLGDIPGTVAHATKALELLPEDHHYAESMSALLGLSYWSSGNLDAAYRTLSEGMTLQKTINPTFAVSMAFPLVAISVAQGRLRNAVKLCEQLLDFAAEQGVLQGRADLHLGLTDLYREHGDLNAAENQLQLAVESGKQAALPGWQYRLLVAKARLNQSQEKLEDALELLGEAERGYVRTPLPDVRPLSALRARLWLAQGDLAESLKWLRERGLSVDDELSYLLEFEHLTLARVLLTQFHSEGSEQSIDEVIAFLKRLLKAAEAGERSASVIEISMLLSLAHKAKGDLPAAFLALGNALKLAEPEGYARLFLDEGTVMTQLLTEGIARKTLPSYTARLLALSQRKNSANKAPSALPKDRLLEPLTSRELEILDLMAQGLSNQEISQRLFRALSTVKGHNRNIFGKLLVKNRTEAVARARELGLL